MQKPGSGTKPGKARKLMAINESENRNSKEPTITHQKLWPGTRPCLFIAKATMLHNTVVYISTGNVATLFSASAYTFGTTMLAITKPYSRTGANAHLLRVNRLGTLLPITDCL